MPGGFSLGHALVVAGVLHVALILVGDRVRRSELPRPPRDSELTLVPIEVEPEVAHDVTPPPPESPSPEPQAAPSIVQPAAVASRASRAVEPQAASSAVALPETAPLALRARPGRDKRPSEDPGKHEHSAPPNAKNVTRQAGR